MSDNGFDYWIGTITEEPCPENMYEKIIPSSAWAIFRSEIDYYSNGDSMSVAYRNEIWIPIIKS